MRASFFAGLLSGLAVCCGGGTDPPSAASSTHEHVAPHGGTLTELGEHFAQLETLFDPQGREVRIFVLDGHAERALQIAQAELEIELGDGPAAATILLSAVESALTGERAGATSEFQGSLPASAGAGPWTAVLRSIEVRGRRFENTELAIADSARARPR